MSTKWATDIHINLDLLFTPGTLIGAGHRESPLLDRPLNGAERNLQVRSNRDICSAGILEGTFSAFPDPRPFPSHGNIVTPRTGVSCLGDYFNLTYALTDKSSISWTKAPGRTGDSPFGLGADSTHTRYLYRMSFSFCFWFHLYLLDKFGLSL